MSLIMNGNPFRSFYEYFVLSQEDFDTMELVSLKRKLDGKTLAIVEAAIQERLPRLKEEFQIYKQSAKRRVIAFSTAAVC